MPRRFAISVLVLAAIALMVPAVALGAPATQTPPANQPTRYDLDFTLPTAGKSGCTVCHGDPNLTRVENGEVVSLYVDETVIDASAHTDVPCTGCHVDFAYETPHEATQSGDEWRDVAKLACKNCKDHGDAYTKFVAGAHSPAVQPGATSTTEPQKRKPLCGDCHGGHAIPSMDDTAAMVALKETGLEMCGNDDCHVDYATSYADYYHGQAYQMSAIDAPACWNCHRAHDVLPADNRASAVHPDQIELTCQECHEDPNEGYAAYSELVHGKQEILESIPIYRWIDSARDSIGNAVETVQGWFG